MASVGILQPVADVLSKPLAIGYKAKLANKTQFGNKGTSCCNI